MKRLAVFSSAFMLTLIQAEASSITINASGSNGRDGNDGQSYSTSSQYNSFGYGSDGRDGGDAGHAEAGDHANNINVQIVESENGTYQIVGQKIDSTTGRVIDNFRHELKSGSFSTVSLLANGGDGGDGGDGGNGEGGEDGGNGSEATCYSSGTNGKSGGNGGDGGDATPGANGGDAGNISVKVSETSTHLLMEFQYENSPGRGGRGGVNGQGGRGGDGGRGGSSYSCPRRDYNGNTVYDRKSGGYSGSSGSRGRSGNGDTSDGRSGKSASYVINVQGENGTKQYSRLYNLRTLSFRLTSENKDGVIEPGEEVILDNLVVQNDSLMPMPKGKKVFINLNNSGSISAITPFVTLDKDLGPNESYSFGKMGIKFRVDENARNNINTNLANAQNLNLDGTMEVVKREFKDFHNGRSIVVRNPIEIKANFDSASLLPGQEQDISWSITNISNKSYGQDGEIARLIEANFRYIKGDLTTENIKLTDLSGNELDLAKTMTTSIERLGPGQTVEIRAKLTVLNSAEAYTGASFNHILNLGKLHNGSEARPIHNEDFIIRVSSHYNPNSDGDLLLIVNYNTDKHQIKAWKETAKKLGMSLDVWDVSNKGYLNLNQSIMENTTLAQNLKNKTIILLDPTEKNYNYISENEMDMDSFVENGLKYGINIYRVEARKSRYDVESSYRGNPNKEVIELTSIDDFYEALEDEVVNHPANEQTRNNDYTQKAYKIHLEDSYIFSKDYSWDFDDLVRDFKRDLGEAYPERRYYISERYDGDDLKDSIPLINYYKLGTITVERGTDKDDWIFTNSSTGFDENAIRSEENRFGLILALSFPQKVKLLDKYVFQSNLTVESNQKIAQEVQLALLVDLTTEQGVATRERDASTFWTSVMKKKLDKLAYLANYDFEYVLRPQTLRSKFIEELVAGLYAFNESGLQWTDKYIPFWRSSDAMVYRALEESVTHLAYNMYKGSKTKNDQGEIQKISRFGNLYMQGKFEDEIEAYEADYVQLVEELKGEIEGADPTSKVFIFRNKLLTKYKNLN